MDLRAAETRILQLQEQIDLLKLKVFELETNIAAVAREHKLDFEGLTEKWRELSLAVGTMATQVATLAAEQVKILRATSRLSRQHQTSHLALVHVIAAMVMDRGDGREPSADLRKALVFAEQVFDPIGPDPEAL